MLRRSVLKLGLAGLCLPLAGGLARATDTSVPGAAFSADHFDLDGVVRPQGLADAGDGALWVSGEGNGALARFDPRSGKSTLIALDAGAAPRGIASGPDNVVWVADGGLNAIVRADAASGKANVFPLPERGRAAELDSVAIDRLGRVWFTGRRGIIGRFQPSDSSFEIWDAPRGRGASGLALTPSGELWYVSQEGNHLGRIDVGSGQVMGVEAGIAEQGARSIASDSRNRLWIAETKAGGIAAYAAESGGWSRWKMPGSSPSPQAIHVDADDKVWVSDLAGNAIVRFDPVTEGFAALPSDRPDARVGHMTSRAGELWASESGTNRLVRIRTTKPA